MFHNVHMYTCSQCAMHLCIYAAFRHNTTKKTYFGSFFIKVRPNCSRASVNQDDLRILIGAESGLVFINSNLHLSWNRPPVEFVHDHGSIRVERNTCVLRFPDLDLEFVVMRHCRKKHYLGFMVSNQAGLSKDANGVMGETIHEITGVGISFMLCI